jgi:hypothetical protein
MRNKPRSVVGIGVRIGLAALVACASLDAQTLNRKIDFPNDSPVVAVSSDWGDSNATVRGGAYFVDVHAGLTLRNLSQKRIRGITLAVLAQEVTPGGKGAVSQPSLDVGPGETFSLRIDMPLLRPLGGGQSGPAVEVRLDGVLFDDLSFYGPDKLHSKRTLTVWELEARRDRKYFKTLLEAAGREGLQKEMLSSLARQGERLQPGVQMVRGRATNTDPDREVQFAFVELPESPVQPLGGTARVAGNEARAPRFEVHNRSTKPIRHLEIGWIVKDQRGREFVAASMPAEVSLGPNQSGPVVEDAALRFPERLTIEGMSGFVSNVEFADGSYWIPSRGALDDPRLRDIVAPSPEEQRLTQIYRKKGLSALIEELKKF